MKYNPTIAPVILSFLVFSQFYGCASDDLPVNDNACADGETRCLQNMVQKCSAGTWTNWTDCSIKGQLCAPADGNASCFAETSSDSIDITDTNSDSGDTHTETTDSGSDTADTATDTTDTTDTTVDTADTNSETGDSSSDTVDTSSDTADTDSDTVDTATTDSDTSVCGDTLITGNEACDDGNQTPLDGCSSMCQLEPDCPASAPCESICGDGVVVNEECDDGNKKSGDGCSATCETESGFTCSNNCEGPDCKLVLDARYREFAVTHPDFQPMCSGSSKGVVEDTLSVTGTPVPTNMAPIRCIGHLEDWYSGPPTLSEHLVLFQDTAGTFVNRYGANGEKWIDNDQQEYNGTPLFFPLDEYESDTDDLIAAQIAPEYNSDNQWVPEEDFTGVEVLHNFYFTSELQMRFTYRANPIATFDVLGDDDVWVFVNGHLAIDLGGTHTPQSGTIELDAAAAQDYELEEGNVYTIHIFQAERKKDGSTMRISATNFTDTKSFCTK